jgi:hypothetical protein
LFIDIPFTSIHPSLSPAKKNKKQKESNGEFEIASYSSVRNPQQGVRIEQIHKGIVQPISQGRRGRMCF